MKVTTAPTSLTARKERSETPNKPEQAPEQDQFRASSPDKNRIGYEVAYNFGKASGAIFKGATKTGQFLHLTTSALGAQPTALAGSLGMMGGTLDVATGASIAKKSAFDRNTKGCVLGSLQVAQGVATWASVASTLFGAPAAVGRVAAFAALGAFAARQGVAGFDAAKGMFGRNSGDDTPAKPESGATAGAVTQGMVAPGLAQVFQGGSIGAQAAIPKTDDDLKEQNELLKEDRGYEKTFAAVRAVDQWAQRLGGVGAMWTNWDAIRGNEPSGVWGTLGLVGATYSVATGVSGLIPAAVNRNKEATISGALNLVQGLGTAGAALGLGKAAGYVSLGAWVGKQAYTIYAQSKRFKSGGEDEGKSVGSVITDNLKNSFWGSSTSVTDRGGDKTPPTDKAAQTGADKPKDSDSKAA